MIIQIKQKAISSTDEYQIFVNNKLEFYAISQPLKKSAKIDFYRNDNLILKLAKENFGIRANYLIQDSREGNKIFEFKEINNIKLVFRCQINEDNYQLFGHNGNKYSIFKNNEQIAFWEGSEIILGEQDYYEIVANDNEDILLLSTFCICIDNSKSNFKNELSLFSFNIGFNGRMLREFDKNWSPNKQNSGSV